MIFSSYEFESAARTEQIKRILAYAVYNPTEEHLGYILDTIYSGADARLFILKSKIEVAGVIGLRQRGDEEAEILHIAVGQTSRNQGIGRKLIAEAQLVSDVRRMVAETDRTAVGFYRRCGFAIQSLGEKYPGTERFWCVLREK